MSSDVALKLNDYVLNKVRVPFIVFAAAGTTELRSTHPLFLRTSFSNQHAAIGLALWVKEHPVVPAPKPRWACIHTDYTAGPDFCNGFALMYRQIGEEIGRVPVPFKTLEKKPQLVQLAKLQPDFAFFAGAEAAAFMQDYYRLKIHEKIPLLIPGFATTGQLLVAPHLTVVSCQNPLICLGIWRIWWLRPKLLDYKTLSPVTTVKCGATQLLQAYEKTLDQYGTAIGVLSALHWAVELENQENQTFVGLHFGHFLKPSNQGKRLSDNALI